MTIVFVTAAALIDTQRRVLIAKRPENKAMGGLWEFPGGKIEAGETPEAALIRELEEELGIMVKQACLSPFVFASAPLGDKHLILLLYLIRRWEGEPRAREHQEIRWVAPRDLRDYPMPPADAPFIAWLCDTV